MSLLTNIELPRNCRYWRPKYRKGYDILTWQL